MFVQDGDGTLAASAAATTAAIRGPSSSYRDVTYSCGSCGYALNLSSSKRNTTNFGAKYGKAIKKGIISFFSIDESRFSKSDGYRCAPYFHSKHSWGLFQRRTKLLCGKCGNRIGIAYEENPSHIVLEGSDSSSENGAAVCMKYNIKISALQPSSDESGVAFLFDTCK